MENSDAQSPNYVMNRSDFDRIILPCLSQFTFMPDLLDKDWHGEPVANALWLLSSSEYRFRSEGRDLIMGKCDVDAVGAIVYDLRKTVERLTQAQSKSISTLRIIATRKQCPACQKFDRTLVQVDKMLSDFFAAKPQFPHELQVADAIAWCEAPGFVDTIEMRPGDDPEFHAYLVDLLDSGIRTTQT
jgi:hypothetical protein